MELELEGKATMITSKDKGVNNTTYSVTD